MTTTTTPRRRSARPVRRALIGAGAALLAVECAVPTPVAPSPVPPADGHPGSRPFLGWSTWEQQAYRDGGSPVEKMNAAFIEQQSDAMKANLGAAGYEYINIDDFWWSTDDVLGRQLPDPRRFPDGIAGVARHVHANGQKVGI